MPLIKSTPANTTQRPIPAALTKQDASGPASKDASPGEGQSVTDRYDPSLRTEDVGEPATDVQFDSSQGSLRLRMNEPSEAGMVAASAKLFLQMGEKLHQKTIDLIPEELPRNYTEPPERPEVTAHNAAISSFLSRNPNMEFSAFTDLVKAAQECDAKSALCKTYLDSNIDNLEVADVVEMTKLTTEYVNADGLIRTFIDKRLEDYRDGKGPRLTKDDYKKLAAASHYGKDEIQDHIHMMSGIG